MSKIISIHKPTGRECRVRLDVKGNDGLVFVDFDDASVWVFWSELEPLVPCPAFSENRAKYDCSNFGGTQQWMAAGYRLCHMHSAFGNEPGERVRCALESLDAPEWIPTGDWCSNLLFNTTPYVRRES
jgi:hypothetical protein